ncbi:MAG: DUF4175 family protein, partial [Bacteroidia bacterium]|nr:DUF4175 family protein [Bacteroidia bacterium]
MKIPGNINSLHARLDEFVRKYYKNQLIKGLILASGGLVLAFLAGALLEHLGRLGTGFRAFIFYGYIAFALTVIAVYIAVPVFKLLKMGKIISRVEASKMIGAHFPEVQDKLLNTLQLEEQYKSSNENMMLMASIDQRILSLSPFKFNTAIDLRKNLKYARYAAVPLGLLLIILIFQSNIITGSAKRIVNYDKQFEQEAPFKFNLVNKDLSVVRNSDLQIQLKMTGNILPNEVTAIIDGNLVKMERKDKQTFIYDLKNVQKNHDVHFASGQFNSNTYKVTVLPNPVLMKFETILKFPSYTGKPSEVLNNTGDLTLPAGTTVEWRLQTKDVEQVSFVFDGTITPTEVSEEKSSLSRRFLRSSQYLIQLGNRYVQSKDTIKYRVEVIPDRYPEINAESKKDSFNNDMLYFFGGISDDYGIRNLQFHYKFTASENRSKLTGPVGSIPVKTNGGTDQTFYYDINLQQIGVEPGDELEYYFEVWDNDGVNGSKSSRSAVIKYASATEKEMSEQAEKSSSSIKQKMEEAIKEAESIQKRSQSLKKDLFENKTLSYEDKKKVQDLLKDQKELEKKLEELKDENKNLKEQEKNKELEQQLLEKQKQIDKLFEELMTLEMKELFKKLEEMMKQNDKEGMQEQLDKMKQNDKDLQKQLDRALEQFKQLEIEKKINEQADALEKLAEKQEELAKKTEEKKESQEELKKEQEKLEQKFEDIKKELDDIQKKNEDLENKMDLKPEEQEKQEESIDQNMDDSKENLDKKQNKKSSDKQKKAAEEMKEMSQKMKENLAENEEEKKE